NPVKPISVTVVLGITLTRGTRTHSSPGAQGLHHGTPSPAPAALRGPDPDRDQGGHSHPEIFQHRYVRTRPREEPVPRRGLRGRHGDPAVRQRRPEPEGGAAGAVDAAVGGAAVPGYWNDRTAIFEHIAQINEGKLNTWRGYFNQSEDVSHTFQEMTGCTVGSDWSFHSGYSRFLYDGTEYVSLNKDLSSWTSTDTAAQVTWRKLVQVPDVKDMKAYLEGECLHWLHKYLEKGKEMLLRAGTRAWASPRKGSVGWAGFPQGEEGNGAV
ncbi:H-2 class I histocompatibility antigen, alpha chain-like, partial [Sturnira hondurensis]|uniref:H-2 class I histocompatibility antigen, alpha chain-like n=1 Tax=Sturnira hondurensis TaxID=192404 RepID=UPI00187A3C01